MRENQLDAILEDFYATLEFKVAVIEDAFEIRDEEIKAQIRRIDAALYEGVPRPELCPTP